MSDIKIQTLRAIDNSTQIELLAKHMPQGRMWINSFNPDSNMGKLIMGLAVEYYRLGLLIEEATTEVDIDQTVKLLESWEESVGIPTDVFDIATNSIADRRKNIKYLFSNFWGVQTTEDFVRVAGYYDYDVEVEAAGVRYTFPLYFPIYFFSNKSVKYTIIVRYTSGDGSSTSYFPLYFPYYFNDGGIAFLESLFELLAPANVEVKFISA